MGEQVAAGFYGGVAQLGEHLPCKQGVMSSNLTISTKQRQKTIANVAYVPWKPHTEKMIDLNDLAIIKKKSDIQTKFKKPMRCNAIHLRIG